MNTQLKIYIDRLRDGHTEIIQEEISSDFLEIDEVDLHFSPKVSIEGKAYLADDHLIVHFDLSLSVILPCTICNEPVTLPLHLREIYHTVPVNTLKNHIFDYGEEVREVILLNTPDFVECKGGNCPKRREIKKYLAREETPGEESSSHVQYPFSDLEKKTKK